MWYKFGCEDFDCSGWRKIIELPHTGGKCPQCEKPLVLKDDSNQLRAMIAQAEAMERLAHAERLAERLTKLAFQD